MQLHKFIIVILLLVGSASFAKAGQYSPAAQSMDNVCEEIGLKAVAPVGCLLSMVNYKGRSCYSCRAAEKCNPECNGGKICINKRCVCPSNRGLVDCNGVCVSGLQCKGLASTKRRVR